MSVKYLDRMTWPEIKAEIENGCRTVIICFGSHEQHGPHLPLGTDAFFGDSIGEGLAMRFNAFLAPVFRVGCSEHHMGFPGTITLTSETFQNLVIDTTQSLSRHGFEKILLIPTHGGNFKPLENAVNKMGAVKGCQIVAFTDLDGFIATSYESASKRSISKGQAGIHAGEWETSFMLELKPDLVKMKEAVTGYTGEFTKIKDKIFKGLHLINVNGVLGDPTLASRDCGRGYLDDIIEFIFESLDG